MYRVAGRQEVLDDRVSGLVIGGVALFLLAESRGFLLRAGEDLHEGVLDVVHADERLAASDRQQGGLVEQVGEIGAGKAGGRLGYDREIDRILEFLVSRVDLEYRLAPCDVGVVDRYLPVEASGTEKGGVEDVGAVRRCHDDDAVMCAEAVHLDEQLVERLLSFVVPSAESGSAVASDGVDLVDEDDRCRRLAGGLEEVSHSRGADADVHLDEVGT